MIDHFLIKLRDNKTLISGVLFSAFSFINKGFGFLLLIILASFILPEDYGYLSLFGTFVMLVSYFIAFSTEGYLGVVFFKEGYHGVRKTLTTIFAISSIVLIILSSVIVIGGDHLSKLSSLPFQFLFIGVLVCFFTLYSNIYLDYLRLQEKVVQYGVFSCSNALVNFILSIFLVKNMLLGWEGRVYAQFICCLFYGIYGIAFFVLNRLYEKPSWMHIKKMLIWGIPLIPHLATGFLRQGCDRYIINFYHGIGDVGLFSFGLTTASIITMIGLGFNQSNSVEIYKVLSDIKIDIPQKMQLLKKQRLLYWRIYAVSLVAISVIGYYAIPALFPKYYGAIYYFLLLSIYGFFFCIYLIYTNYLFYYNMTRQIMYITFISSITHLALSLLLTRYSLYITAMLYIVTQMITSLCIMYIAKRNLSKNLNNV